MENRNRENKDKNWPQQDQESKRHGDKVSDLNANNRRSLENDGVGSEDGNSRYDSNAEFADPQDTNHDYLKQTQQLSDRLESIYPGKQTTKEEREKLAKDRKSEGVHNEVGEKEGSEDENQKYNKKPYSPSTEDGEEEDYKRQTSEYGKQGSYMRTGYSEEGSKEKDDFRKYQDGKSMETRSPDYPSARQNSGDDDLTNFSENQEQGMEDINTREQRPWDLSGSTNDDDEDEYVKAPVKNTKRGKGSYEEEFHAKFNSKRDRKESEFSRGGRRGDDD